MRKGILLNVGGIDRKVGCFGSDFDFDSGFDCYDFDSWAGQRIAEPRYRGPDFDYFGFGSGSGFGLGFGFDFGLRGCWKLESLNISPVTIFLAPNGFNGVL